ncbi:hypothetical protein HCH_03888 [Hahella chejuensis KCTC 2396]|uniref:Uncharacterized protein n=1 Tax=Hahella chejuensis (strain KCTC 2396) TaxID=349521 RepID=Q2SFF9_HAHCH|nr:hypothetical protein [Hahella chejuensis]ABC30615.1 hypothetical protein HCH_03888 [Hahella chejuensis KCTC 2396]
MKNRHSQPRARLRSRLRARSFSERDIADQFQGLEVEFNDKVTLFPVQVERDAPPRRRRPMRNYLQ